MTLLKYAVGIDVSKDFLQCCFGQIDSEQSLTIGKSRRFENSPAGFVKLIEWAQHHCDDTTIECWFFLEATGVYYEPLAFFLSEHQCKLCVALPTAVRDFARSTPVKTKNDAVDAAMLTRMALERKLTPWALPSPLIRQIKLLSRERQTLVDSKITAGNRLHALQHSYKPIERSLTRLTQHIELLDTQIKQIERELQQLIDLDPDLKERITNTASIQGVGITTILTILAETNGFVLARSVKQVISYAGLDIVENQSGLARGTTRISKRGNARIRRALYVPAMTAIRHNPQLRTFFLRLVARNGGKKMPALIAVARKLLRLIYTLFRNNTVYDPLRLQPQSLSS